MTNSPFGPLSYPRNLVNDTLAFPSANDFLFPHVIFSEMDLDYSCASELMMVINSSPFASSVQMFSFSK